MGEKRRVLMIVTLDSKEAEARFLRKCLEESGMEVYHLDASIRRCVDAGAAITPDQVAAAAGKSLAEVRALKDEGKCISIMTEGAIRCAHDLDRRVGFSGIIAAGGSLGTALASAVMQTFPFGLPKMMISTMASGMTKPFVGTRDIIMFNSVADIAGLNTITCRIFQNSARALAGMALGYEPLAASGKPLVTITTLSVTEKCCGAVRSSLEQKGFEVMVFHTSGNGGGTMDEVIREQAVSVVVDLSLIEVSDFLCQGIFSGGPDRCKAALEKGVPTVLVPGNIDFMVAGPIADAQVRFPGRRYHIHNPQLTAVRAEAGEFRRMAEHMAGLVKSARGPVAWFVPLLGFSEHDSPRGYLHDPSLPPVFAEYLKEVMPEGVPITVLPHHINDAPFAEKLTEQVIAFQEAGRKPAARRQEG
jgi:uncharacterized protein (UPF0261 family)